MARDEEILERFCACRDVGDLEGAARHWGEMVERQADRVRGMVETWPGGRLSPDESDDALSDALDRLWRRMRHTWRGTSMGEWVMSTVVLVDFACRDARRRSMARKRRERSLDRPWTDEDGTRHEAPASLIEPELRRRAEAEEDAAEIEERMALIRRHLPRLENVKHRRAIELVLDGGADADLAAEYGVEVNTVQVWRSRGLRALALIIARESGGGDVS